METPNIAPEIAAPLLLNRSLVDIAKATCHITHNPAYMRSLSDQLTATAIKAASVAAYLDARGGSGRGDGGHADGVKAFNREQSKIRKALGFSHPDADNVSF